MAGAAGKGLTEASSVETGASTSTQCTGPNHYQQFLARFLSSGGLVPPTIATQQVELASSEQAKDTGVNLLSTSQGDRFFSENKKTKVSAELLDLTMKAFSKSLSVEK